MVRYERNRNLVEYFKKNLTKGYTSDSLKWALVKQGYLRIEVMKALEKANKELAEEAPVLKEKPKIKYQIVDEYDRPITIKHPWWKKLLARFR